MDLPYYIIMLPAILVRQANPVHELSGLEILAWSEPGRYASHPWCDWRWPVFQQVSLVDRQPSILQSR